MRALTLEAPRRFAFVDVPEPVDPGPGQALAQVRRMGVCGTDLSAYLGKMPFFEYPRVPGHELGIEVLAVGEGVQRVKKGDLCSVEPYLNNPLSFASASGRSNCCEELRVLGVHCDGGLLGRLIVPADKLHSSASLSCDQLALVETLAIGCHAVDRGRAEAGEFALVIGAGPIGLSAVTFLKQAGSRVLVMDINERRLAFCRETMGVERARLARGDERDVAALREMTDGRLPTLVMDATGSPRSMANALTFAAHGGRVVYVGLTTEHISFPHPLMHRRELSLLSSRNAVPENFQRIIGLIEKGAIDTAPWITHRAPLDQVIEAFPSFLEPATGCVKPIIEVS